MGAAGAFLCDQKGGSYGEIALAAYLYIFLNKKIRDFGRNCGYRFCEMGIFQGKRRVFGVSPGKSTNR